MACHGARRLLAMTENLYTILGIEMLTAAQGVEFRAPHKTSAELARVMAALRAAVPSLEADRFMAPDLAEAASLVANGSLIAATSPGILPGL